MGSPGGLTHIADFELFDFSLPLFFPMFLVFRKVGERKGRQSVPVPFSHHSRYSNGILTSSMA